MDSTMDRWDEVFASEVSFVELFARGSLLYFAILVLMRIMPRRTTAGELAVMDLVFVVILADAAARALGDYQSVTDALLLIMIIMGWNYVLNYLSFRVRFVERLLSPGPLQVVRDGELLWGNMRRELLTEGELMDQLRQKGIDTLEQVKAAYVEAEGKLTVICKT